MLFQVNQWQKYQFSIFFVRGDAIDLDSLVGNIVSECEKTEETLMNTWFKDQYANGIDSVAAMFFI